MSYDLHFYHFPDSDIVLYIMHVTIVAQPPHLVSITPLIVIENIIRGMTFKTAFTVHIIIYIMICKAELINEFII